MLRYGNGGETVIEIVSKGRDTGVRVTFTDCGPEIADIGRAMEDGYTTGRSMGLGLPGAKRLASEFDIQSELGKGTRITILKWANG
ncbi:MAG: anti-sigma regulatory factor [Sphingobacteriaceae bacterium]|nr:anti-sigma regulatory factor [Sphingobacteriaceae bacterium]